MATKITLTGNIRSVKQDWRTYNGHTSSTLKVLIEGDDGNTYWFSSSAKFVWDLERDERITVEATEKDRRPANYGDGEFVVVNRPKLVESHGVEHLDDFTRDVERMEKEGTVAPTAPLETPEPPKGDGDDFDFNALLDEAQARLRTKGKERVEA